MKKPRATDIRAARPLTRDRLLHAEADPMAACNLCGHGPREPKEGPLRWAVYREHDESDRPMAGDEALVFLAVQHTRCMQRLEKHPRLYVEERGNPGHFPRLCGPCEWREGTACTHPNLKVNGGSGLHVSIDYFDAILVCTRGARGRPLVRHATRCEGFVPNEVEVEVVKEQSRA